jgi:hypothetical protein
MSSLLIHDLDTAWASSSPGTLTVTVDTATFSGAGAASNRLTARAGAINQFAEIILPAPLDLRAFEELRLSVRGSVPADGSTNRPFLLEFSYVDDGDTAGEEHRWFVPINRAGFWEQRRIGIEADRRGAVRRFRLRCLTDRPFVCNIDELLAVHEEMLADVEAALIARIGGQTSLPGLSGVPLSQPANPGQLQVVMAGALDFDVDNRVLIRGGSAGDETHTVTGVARAGGATTLTFGTGDGVVGTLAAGTATVTVLVPALDVPGLTPPAAPQPAIALSRLEVREDLERTPYIAQRDSFRRRGALVVCSVRPSARAYTVDYQLSVVAQRRAHVAAILTGLHQRLSTDIGLRINGAVAPVRTLAAPVVEERLQAGMPLEAALYVRIGTRLETAPRREAPWIQQAAIAGGPLNAPLDPDPAVPVDLPPDPEGIVIVL